MALGVLFDRNDAPFWQGMKAAAVAIAASLAVLFFLPFLWPGHPVSALLVAPFVEEAARFFLIAKSAFILHKARAWFLFGLGFGLLEGMQKFIDAGVKVASGDWQPIMLAAPIVPALMHVALALLACASIRAGLPWVLGMALTTGIHFAHNWTALQATSMGEFYDLLFWRSLLFLAIISSVMRWARQFDPMTSAAAHANTRQ